MRLGQVGLRRYLRAHLPLLGLVVGISNLSVDQSVADISGCVGQPELAIVRVQPMLQGSEEDHGGVVDAGDLREIDGNRAVSATHQKIDRAA